MNISEVFPHVFLIGGMVLGTGGLLSHGIEKPVSLHTVTVSVQGNITMTFSLSTYLGLLVVCSCVYAHLQNMILSGLISTLAGRALPILCNIPSETRDPQQAGLPRT